MRTKWMVQAPVHTRFQSVSGFLSSSTVHRPPCPDRMGPVVHRSRRLTLGIDPVGIEVWQRGLVARMLDGLGGLLVDQAAGPPSAAALFLGVGG